MKDKILTKKELKELEILVARDIKMERKDKEYLKYCGLKQKIRR